MMKRTLSLLPCVVSGAAARANCAPVVSKRDVASATKRTRIGFGNMAGSPWGMRWRERSLRTGGAAALLGDLGRSRVLVSVERGLQFFAGRRCVGVERLRRQRVLFQWISGDVEQAAVAVQFEALVAGELNTARPAVA